MRRISKLWVAAALCIANADETVTLKRDAPADEPEVQASMNSLGGAFMPAVGEDYENEAAKEAERVRLSQAAEQAEARARAEHAQRLEEAQRAYAAQQQAAQTAALERAKAEALAQAEAAAAAKAEAEAAAAQEDASPETETHTPMHAEAAELAQAYAAAAETLSGISGEEEEEEAADAAPEAEEDAEAASEEQATPEEQAAAAEALRAENARRLREAVAQQQRQLREAELARRAEQQAAYAAAQATLAEAQQAGVTTDALREHTMPIKQDPRSPLESDLRPADADQLKEIYQRDQKLAEMRQRAQVDPSTELRRAQAWAELPARERRSCAAEVSRITKNYKRGHYAVLGLRRSASHMEIRQRYRQKALLVHPEKNPSPDARLAFEQLREAGETLADDRLRDAYDRKLQRQQEEKLDHFRGEVLAFAETSAEYLQARLREFPRVLYGAAAVSFLLV